MADEPPPSPTAHGLLALSAGKYFQLQVCKSQGGYYIGTLAEDGTPYTRESQEYWREQEDARTALRLASWTQKMSL